MAAWWVQVVLLVWCSATVALPTTPDKDLESSIQGPPDKPINVRFESVNFNHTLKWDLAPDHDDSTLFTVQYIGAAHRERYPSPEEWQEKATCINITLTCCVLLKELRTDGTWWARVRAFNSYGTSDWASSGVFRPFDDTRLGAPDLHIRQVSKTRLVLRVRAPKTPFYDSDHGGRIRVSDYLTTITWMITYQDVESDLKLEKETPDRDVILDSLHPGKHYCITVRGTYMDKEGATGRICADTEEDAPTSGARELSVSVDDCTPYPMRHVMLSWQPPPVEDWNGELQEYEVSYREAGTHQGQTIHSVVPVNVTNFTLRDLSVSKEYLLNVAACTAAGCSEEPAEHYLRRVAPFKADTVQYPPNVSAVPLSPTSMQVSWNSLEGACVQGYTIQYDPALDPISVDSGNTVNLTGLVPGTEYHVCVTARLPTGPQSGDCTRETGVYARTGTGTDGHNILVETVLPGLAVLSLVLLCVLIVWKRGSPFMSFSKINIVLPPVLVEIKETKDKADLEPISHSLDSSKEKLDDIPTIRTDMIRKKSKFIKSLQNLPDALALNDNDFTNERQRLLSWKSEKDIVLKVVISKGKGKEVDVEPSSPTSTDSGHVSGPCSLTADCPDDEEESQTPVTTYKPDSPVSAQTEHPIYSYVRAGNTLQTQTAEKPTTFPEWPEAAGNETTSSEIESYVQATNDAFRNDVRKGLQANGDKGQSSPYVLAENLPPPVNQGIRPTTGLQPIGPSSVVHGNREGQETDMPAPSLPFHINLPSSQSMSSESSVDPYVVSTTPLLQPPIPADTLDSPSSSSTSSIDPYVQAAAGRPSATTWQNQPSSLVYPQSTSSESDVDPYIRATGRPQQPVPTGGRPSSRHAPRRPPRASQNTDYQDPWVLR